ncbi:Gfo/Idh/MocA family protein [Planctomonas psychrotolerans]|uniref:Gfo/Idh/MocA family protein n=1 Tax=Planctomonas psychrotolerans TaxID=2528712 RepID=UPI001D0D2181|nr:Gfo/Idh/MocA family oxidoreductase [Planctomonas psychrotolerans]
MPLRVGIAGSGALARIRAEAITAATDARIVAVASRRAERAGSLASLFPGAEAMDTDRLFDAGLDAVIVALPHRVQDTVALRALDAGIDVLVGGPLASDTRSGKALLRRSAETGLIVEAGYEARYKKVWRDARQLLEDKAIGELVSVRSVAGFDQLVGSWYYDEQQSGGMLVTHLSYAFLNPLRWLLGEARMIGAAGNVKRVTGPGSVDPETCVAVAEFPGGVVASMTASYVSPEGLDDWGVTIVGTAGALVISPGDLDGGQLQLLRSGHQPQVRTSPGDGFTRQAAAFARAVQARRAGESHPGELLNPPADALRDLVLCDDIRALLDRHERGRASRP